jgi:hypothetical protein
MKKSKKRQIIYWPNLYLLSSYITQILDNLILVFKSQNVTILDLLRIVWAVFNICQVWSIHSADVSLVCCQYNSSLFSHFFIGSLEAVQLPLVDSVTN